MIIFPLCQEWTVLSSLVSASREKKLEQLQKIFEMDEFVQLVTSEGRIKTVYC